MKLRTRNTVMAIGLALTFTSQAVLSQDIGKPDEKVVKGLYSGKGLYPGKTYSPYAKRSFPAQVYWGDTHLHTALSPDAGLFGNKLGLDEAYRFARGEEVISSTGLPAKLSRPLDWLVLTEHTDMMGFATDLIRGAPNLLAVPKSVNGLKECKKVVKMQRPQRWI